MDRAKSDCPGATAWRGGGRCWGNRRM